MVGSEERVERIDPPAHTGQQKTRAHEGPQLVDIRPRDARLAAQRVAHPSR